MYFFVRFPVNIVNNLRAILKKKETWIKRNQTIGIKLHGVSKKVYSCKISVKLNFSKRL